MKSSQITPGDVITFEQETYRVEGLDGPCIRMRNIDGGAAKLILAASVLTDPSFSTVEAGDVPPSSSDSKVGRRRVSDAAVLELLDNDEQTRVKELVCHLNEVATGYPAGEPTEAVPTPRDGYGPNATMRQKMADKSAELGISEPTIWRNYRRWRELGAWGLVDQRKAKGINPLGNLDKRLVEAMRDQIAIEMEESTGTFDRFHRRLMRRLEETYGTDVVPVPSKRTVRRGYTALTLGVLAGPADTRRTRERQPKKTYGHARATRHGELVALDSTRLDVMAYDPNTDKAHPIELSIAVDVATRSILAWRCTVVGTNATDATLLLADMMTPEPMRVDWDDKVRFDAVKLPIERLMTVDERLAAAAARPIIFPETVVVDHGKIYVGEVFTAGCARLGINLQPSRKARPTDKAIVERVFRVVGEQFSGHLAGYKGRSVAHRGTHAEDAARWTLEEIEELFAEWVVAVYQRRIHSGLTLPGYPGVELSPNDAYAESLARIGWIPVPNNPNLYYELLPIQWRTINHYGVEIDGLTYDGDILGDYRRVKSPYPERNGRWPFRVDPRSPLHVYFLDLDGNWNALRWSHAPDFLQPFADITASYVKRQLRHAGLNPADQDEVARALISLQNRADAGEVTTATDRRTLLRDRARTRSALKDQQRAQTIDISEPTMRIVAEPDDDDIDFDNIQPFDTV